MPKQQELAESAMMPAAEVELALGISRQTRLALENNGVLHPVRFTPNGHRRYNRAEVEALAASDTDE